MSTFLRMKHAAISKLGTFVLALVLACSVMPMHAQTTDDPCEDPANFPDCVFDVGDPVVETGSAGFSVAYDAATNGTNTQTLAVTIAEPDVPECSMVTFDYTVNYTIDPTTPTPGNSWTSEVSFEIQDLNGNVLTAQGPGLPGSANNGAPINGSVTASSVVTADGFTGGVVISVEDNFDDAGFDGTFSGTLNYNLTIVPATVTCPVSVVTAISDPCSCDNPNNVDLDGDTTPDILFEQVTIDMGDATATGLTWTLSSGSGLLDNTGNPVGAITQVDNGDGTYTLDFWTPEGTGYSAIFVNNDGVMSLPISGACEVTCLPECPFDLSGTTIETQDENCYLDMDGEITITAGPDTPADLMYSIDGGLTFQASNMFTGLTDGIYNIAVGVTSDPDCLFETFVLVRQGYTMEDPGSIQDLKVCVGDDIVAAGGISVWCNTCPETVGSPTIDIIPLCGAELPAPAVCNTTFIAMGPGDLTGSSAPINYDGAAATVTTATIDFTIPAAVPTCAENLTVNLVGMTANITPNGASWTSEVDITTDFGNFAAGTAPTADDPTPVDVPVTPGTGASIFTAATNPGGAVSSAPFNVTITDSFDDGGIDGAVTFAYALQITWDEPQIICVTPAAGDVTTSVPCGAAPPLGSTCVDVTTTPMVATGSTTQALVYDGGDNAFNVMVPVDLSGACVDGRNMVATITASSLDIVPNSPATASWSSEVTITTPFGGCGPDCAGTADDPTPVLGINLPVTGGDISASVTLGSNNNLSFPVNINDSFNDGGATSDGTASVTFDWQVTWDEVTQDCTVPAAGGVGPASVNWYDDLTGGNLVATTNPFDPTGFTSAEGTVVDNTVPGTYTFYAECDCLGCVSHREPVTLTVCDATIDDTSICLSPSGSAPLSMLFGPTTSPGGTWSFVGAAPAGVEILNGFLVYDAALVTLPLSFVVEYEFTNSDGTAPCIDDATVTIEGGNSLSLNLPERCDWIEPFSPANFITNPASNLNTYLGIADAAGVPIDPLNLPAGQTGCWAIVGFQQYSYGADAGPFVSDVPDGADTGLGNEVDASEIDLDGTSGSLAAGFIDTATGDYVPGNGPGTVTVRYTLKNASLGCSSIVESTILLLPSITADVSACECNNDEVNGDDGTYTVTLSNVTGGAVNLGLTGINNYQWQGTGTSPGAGTVSFFTGDLTVSVNDGQPWSITVIDPAGCTQQFSGSCNSPSVDIEGVIDQSCSTDPSYNIFAEALLDDFTGIPGAPTDFGGFGVPSTYNIDFAGTADFNGVPVIIDPAENAGFIFDFATDPNTGRQSAFWAIPAPDPSQVCPGVLNTTGFDIQTPQFIPLTPDVCLDSEFTLNVYVDGRLVESVPSTTGTIGNFLFRFFTVSPITVTTASEVTFYMFSDDPNCDEVNDWAVNSGSFGGAIGEIFEGVWQGTYVCPNAGSFTARQITGVNNGMISKASINTPNLVIDNGDGTATVNPGAAPNGGRFVVSYCVNDAPTAGCEICSEEIITIFPEFEADFECPSEACLSDQVSTLELCAQSIIASTFANPAIEGVFDPNGTVNEMNTYIAWSGPGVTDLEDGTGNASFDPAMAGVGVHTIQVEVGYDDCRRYYTCTVTVKPDADATLEDRTVCVSESQQTGLTNLFTASTNNGGDFTMISAYGFGLNGMDDGGTCNTAGDDVDYSTVISVNGSELNYFEEVNNLPFTDYPAQVSVVYNVGCDFETTMNEPQCGGPTNVTVLPLCETFQATCQENTTCVTSTVPMGPAATAIPPATGSVVYDAATNPAAVDNLSLSYELPAGLPVCAENITVSLTTLSANIVPQNGSWVSEVGITTPFAVLISGTGGMTAPNTLPMTITGSPVIANFPTNPGLGTQSFDFPITITDSFDDGGVDGSLSLEFGALAVTWDEPQVTCTTTTAGAAINVGFETSFSNPALPALASEDIDGDGNLDVDEDANCSGTLDVNEDLDGDGNLDVNEDLDADGNLDINETVFGFDVNGDGTIDFFDEDVDGDGALDIVNEDVDADGILDTVNEDVDADANLDVNEDLNGNGVLDLARNNLVINDTDLNGIIDIQEVINQSKAALELINGVGAVTQTELNTLISQVFADMNAVNGCFDADIAAVTLTGGHDTFLDMPEDNFCGCERDVDSVVFDLDDDGNVIDDTGMIVVDASDVTFGVDASGNLVLSSEEYDQLIADTYPCNANMLEVFKYTSIEDVDLNGLTYCDDVVVEVVAVDGNPFELFVDGNANGVLDFADANLNGIFDIGEVVTRPDIHYSEMVVGTCGAPFSATNPMLDLSLVPKEANLTIRVSYQDGVDLNSNGTIEDSEATCWSIAEDNIWVSPAGNAELTTSSVCVLDGTINLASLLTPNATPCGQFTVQCLDVDPNDTDGNGVFDVNDAGYPVYDFTLINLIDPSKLYVTYTVGGCETDTETTVVDLCPAPPFVPSVIVIDDGCIEQALDIDVEAILAANGHSDPGLCVWSGNPVFGTFTPGLNTLPDPNATATSLATINALLGLLPPGGTFEVACATTDPDCPDCGYGVSVIQITIPNTVTEECHLFGDGNTYPDGSTTTGNGGADPCVTVDNPGTATYDILPEYCSDDADVQPGTMHLVRRVCPETIEVGTISNSVCDVPTVVINDNGTPLDPSDDFIESNPATDASLTISIPQCADVYPNAMVNDDWFIQLIYVNQQGADCATGTTVGVVDDPAEMFGGDHSGFTFSATGIPANYVVGDNQCPTSGALAFAGVDPELIQEGMLGGTYDPSNPSEFASITENCAPGDIGAGTNDYFILEFSAEDVYAMYGGKDQFMLNFFGDGTTVGCNGVGSFTWDFDAMTNPLETDVMLVLSGMEIYNYKEDVTAYIGENSDQNNDLNFTITQTIPWGTEDDVFTIVTDPTGDGVFEMGECLDVMIDLSQFVAPACDDMCYTWEVCHSIEKCELLSCDGDAIYEACHSFTIGREYTVMSDVTDILALGCLESDKQTFDVCKINSFFMPYTTTPDNGWASDGDDLAGADLECRPDYATDCSAMTTPAGNWYIPEPFCDHVIQNGTDFTILTSLCDDFASLEAAYVGIADMPFPSAEITSKQVVIPVHYVVTPCPTCEPTEIARFIKVIKAPEVQFMIPDSPGVCPQESDIICLEADCELPNCTYDLILTNASQHFLIQADVDMDGTPDLATCDCDGTTCTFTPATPPTLLPGVTLLPDCGNGNPGIEIDWSILTGPGGALAAAGEELFGDFNLELIVYCGTQDSYCEDADDQDLFFLGEALADIQDGTVTCGENYNLTDMFINNPAGDTITTPGGVFNIVDAIPAAGDPAPTILENIDGNEHVICPDPAATTMFIQYIVGSTTVCADTAYATLNIVPLVATIDDLVFACTTNPSGNISLDGLFTTATTPGGVFTVNGVATGNTFQYTSAGCYAVSYTVDNGCAGCEETDMATILIPEQPQPSFDIQDQVCWSDGDVASHIYTPIMSSPVYDSGTGIVLTDNWTVSGGSATIDNDDASANEGQVTITGTGIVTVCLEETLTTTCAGVTGSPVVCSETFCTTITVSDGTVQDASFTITSQDLCPGATVTLTPATNGGLFEGTGVVDNGTGTGATLVVPANCQDTQVTYTLNDPNGCTSSYTATVFADRIAPMLSVVAPADLECGAATVDADIAAWVAAVEALATAANAAVGTASDNCDFTITGLLHNTISGCGSSRSEVWEFTAEDACGNTTIVYQTINIVDTTDPVFDSVPDNMTVSCVEISETSSPAAMVDAFIGSVVVSDACDTDPEVTYTLSSSLAGGSTILDVCQDADYTITVTWTVTDACGNDDEVSRTITVVADVTAPVITVPAGITLTCDDISETSSAAATIDAWLAQASAADACDTDPELSNDFDVTTLDVCANAQYDITVTWTSNDACGNESTLSSTITIVPDIVAPVITVPAAIQLTCDDISETSSAAATIDAWLSQASAADACDTDPELSNDFDITTLDVCANAQYDITVTWTSNDACGNESTLSSTITIVPDIVAPVITVPAAIQLTCNDISETSSAAATIDAWLAQASAADACDTDPELSNDFDVSTLDVCANAQYDITVTWTSNDACGNESTLSSTITIVPDIVAPVITVPADITLDCADISPTSSPSATIDDWLAQAFATDACDTDPELTLDFDITELDVCADADYDLVVTWKSSDACGNESTNSATITVEIDDVDPTVDAQPMDETVMCGVDIPTVPVLTFSDNCAAVVDVDFSEITSGVSSDNMFTITRTWIATDYCGNQIVVDQVITVTDATQPSVTTCPTDIVVSNDAGVCGAVVMYDIPMFMDNCATNNGTLGTLVEGINSGDVFPVGVTEVEYTFYDENGNVVSAPCTFTVTVNDTEIPEFVNCPDPGYVYDVFTNDCETGANWSVPVAQDNCGVASVTQTAGPAQGDLLAPGTYTVTYVATDDSGNMSLPCTFEISVSDTEDPVIDCPNESFVRGTNDDCTFTMGSTGFDATIVENCPGGSIVNDYNNTATLNGANFPLGNTTVVWTATDAAGNTSTCSITITVEDDDAPTFTCPAAQTVSGCDGVVPDVVSLVTDAADNCPGDLTITQNPVAGELFGPGINMTNDMVIVTVTVTDAAGNMETCEVEVSIVGSELPYFVNCPTETLTFGNDPDQCGAFVNWSIPVALDDCDQPLADVQQTVGPTVGSFVEACEGAMTVTYVATDSDGNSVECSFMIEVLDTQTPIITLSGDTLTVECIGMLPDTAGLEVPVFYDNCADKPFDLEWVDSMDTLCGGSGILTRTWTGIDCGGNVSAPVDQIIKIVDTTAPDLVCPMDTVILEVNDQGLVTIDLASLITVDDVCSDASMPGDTTFTCENLGLNAVSIIVSQEGYNGVECVTLSSICEIVFDVQDNIAPTVTCPADIVVQLGPGECSSNQESPVADDNCSVETYIVVFDGDTVDLNTPYPIGVTVVDITVIDGSGNEAMCSYTAEMLEHIPSSGALSCNDHINLSLDGDCSAILSADIMLEGNDYGCYDDFCIEVLDPQGNDHGIVFDASDIGQTFQVSIVDCTGTTNSCWGTVTVEEKFIPDVACPADATIICNQDPNAREILIVTEDELTDESVIVDQDGDDYYVLGMLITGEPELLSCEPNVSITYEDIITDFGDCDAIVATISRHWIITDVDGNSVTCDQLITVEKFDSDLIATPVDLWIDAEECDYDANSADYHPDVLGYPTLNGHPINGSSLGFCNVSWNWDDQVLFNCGSSFEIIRTWIIRDKCAPISADNPREFVQVIGIEDNTAPIVHPCPDDMIVSVDPWECEASTELPNPTKVSDGCAKDEDLTISVDVFGGGYITHNGTNYVANALSIGVHTIRYSVEDPCGNRTVCEYIIVVRDATPPVAITKENVVLSLTVGQFEQATGKLYPEALDNGSHDGDCGPVRLEVRREDGAPACGNVGVNGHNNNETFNNDQTIHTFDDRDDNDAGAFVKFCCEDLTEYEASTDLWYGEVKVWLRVWDDGNASGVLGDAVDLNGDGDITDPGEQDNYSDTWSIVRVENKLNPQLIAPSDITLKCDYDYTDTSVTGVAEAIGVCHEEMVTFTDRTDLGSCNEGTVERTWCIDGTNICAEQIITLDYVSDWDPCDDDSGIVWPADYTTSGADPQDDDWCNLRNIERSQGPINCSSEDTGEPTWTDASCDLIGTNVDVDTFFFEDDACFKILKYWSVINWCIYNPSDADWNNIPNEFADNDGDGIPNLYDIDDDNDGMDFHYRFNGFALINDASNPFDGKPEQIIMVDDNGDLIVADLSNAEGFDWNADGAISADEGIFSIVRDHSIDVWDLAGPFGADPQGHFGEFDPNTEDDGIAEGLYEHLQVIKYIDEEKPEVDAPTECFPAISEVVEHPYPRYNSTPALDEDGELSQNFIELNCSGFAKVKATAFDTLSDCQSNWLKWQVLVDVWNDWDYEYEVSSFVPVDPSSGLWDDDNGDGIADLAVENLIGTQGTANGDMLMFDLPDPIAGSKTQHRVLWKVTDGCGNVTTFTSYFTVEDKKDPTPYCVNLSTALMGNGQVELWAVDFNQGSFDNCTHPDWLLYTFSDVVPTQLVDPSETSPYYNADGVTDRDEYEEGDAEQWNAEFNSSSMIFDCDDFEAAEANGGTLEVPVYVWDECGNSDFCMVNLKLVDNQGACGGTASRAMIAGQIRTEDGIGVEGLSVEIMTSDDNNYPQNNITDENGEYAFDDNAMYNDYIVSAERMDDWMNGVSTLDLVLIQKHILGVEALDSPYKMIAADASNDQRVSAIDLLEIRRLILGVTSEFANNKSWRAIDGDNNLTVSDPWSFIENIELDQIDENLMDVNFVGIKIGDVNDSAEANLDHSVSQTRSSANLKLSTEFVNTTAEGYEVYSVKASNFTDMWGYQFTMNLDGVEFVDVQSAAVSMETEFIGVINDNTITMSYASTKPLTLAKGEVLFNLVVRRVTEGDVINSINSDVTTAEAYVGSDYKVVDVVLENVESVMEYALSQNEPNPFSESTAITFTLPTDDYATLTIMDVDGKIVRVIKGQYTAGDNTITINRKDINAQSGVLYYRLDSGDFTSTKTMIIIE